MALVLSLAHKYTTGLLNISLNLIDYIYISCLKVQMKNHYKWEKYWTYKHCPAHNINNGLCLSIFISFQTENSWMPMFHLTKVLINHFTWPTNKVSSRNTTLKHRSTTGSHTDPTTTQKGLRASLKGWCAFARLYLVFTNRSTGCYTWSQWTWTVL